MDIDPSPKRGLSLTISWGAVDDPRRLAIPLGAALRVALAASLCAGAYEVGRWQERLLAADAAPKPASAVVVVEKTDKPMKADKSAVSAPGQPAGEPKDVITPLDLRDPTTLVMGPSWNQPPTVAAPPPTPQADVPDVTPPPRKYKKAKDIKPSDRFKPNQNF